MKTNLRTKKLQHPIDFYFSLPRYAAFLLLHHFSAGIFTAKLDVHNSFYKTVSNVIISKARQFMCAVCSVPIIHIIKS